MNPIDLLELGAARRTPFVQQSEASECGLACLAMVSGYHGLKTDLPTLRRRFSLSLKGATLKAVMGIADQIGFHSRPLRGDIHNLGELSLPAILHWDLNHFVVLRKVETTFRRRRYHISDPAKGAEAISESELSRHFTGVVLELTKSETFQPRVERSKLRISQLWSNISGLWGTLRNVLLLSVILQLVALAAPFYLQIAIDTVFPSSDTDLLRMLAFGFGGLVIIQMLTSWLRSFILISLGNSISYQVIVNLFRHLLRLPLPWFERRHIGDIVSRFGSTQPLSDLLTHGLISALIDGTMAFVTLGLLFIYSPLLAGVAVAAWVLFAGIKVVFIQALRMRNISAITAAAKEQSSFLETVRGISAIKAFGHEANRQRMWQQLKADSVNAQVKLGTLSATFDTLGQLILGVEKILFVYLAMSVAIRGQITIGMIFAFQAYKQQFLDSATRLVEQAISYKLLDVHLNRISDIALARPEMSTFGRSEIDSPVRGEIELCNIGFQYGAGDRNVLNNISLKAETGQMVVLTGPSGGGKTTLLKLMMGLIRPNSGQVLIDGEALNAATLHRWRSARGSLLQDDSLFAGSLAENIAFFDPHIEMDRVHEVAKLAAIHDEITSMPMGYESFVGDMGSALSGGQIQRLLLARALYARPQVLFIDEGTAHLDPLNERLVNSVIGGLPITRIVVSHRTETARFADQVYFVHSGKVEKIETFANDTHREFNTSARATAPFSDPSCQLVR